MVLQSGGGDAPESRFPSEHTHAGRYGPARGCAVRQARGGEVLAGARGGPQR